MDLSTHAHRQLIGAFGLVLPALLWIVAGWRPTAGLPQWEVLGSVSAYYYTGAVAAFIGVLIALAVYLFTYRGYDNEYHRRDRVAAIIAGGAAVLVAFCPTDAPGKLPEPSWWTSQTGRIHHIAAVVLFSAFIFFSLFLFTKPKVTAGAPRPPDKRVRNRIYIFCGLGMVACVLWAVSASFTGAPIFWPEAIALELFAVSWLVKGRVDTTVASAGRRTWSAIRGSTRTAPPQQVV